MVARAPRPGRWGGLGLLLLGRAAFAAAPASEPVEARLEVVADPKCATRAALAERIAVRSSRVRLVPGRAPRVVRAELAERRGSVQATLRIVHPNGRRSERRIEARTCDEALDALGLIAAITLDPSGTFPEAEPATEPDEAPQEPPEPEPKAAPSLAPVRAPSRVEERASHGAAPAPSVRFSMGLLGVGTLGPAPGALPGAGAYAFVERETAGAWRPALRLTASHALRGGFPAGPGRADFALTELALELCPLGLAVSSVRLHACAAASGGILAARASEVAEARREERPLWLFGASGSFGVDATRWLEVVALVRGAVPLARDRYQIEPLVFHRVARVAVTGAVGAGIRFP